MLLRAPPGASINPTQALSPAEIPRQASIQYLPVNLFASVMGLSGLALAWRQAGHQFGTSALIDAAIGSLAVVVFAVLCIAYAAKAVLHPCAVHNEFRHPIAGNFFGTITIAVLLISSVVAPLSARASEIIWGIGAASTVALSFTIVSRMLRGKVDAGHSVPAWLIPGVATLDITVAGGTLPMAWAREVNLFAMAVGTTMALVFFTMIMSRLIHHHEKLASDMVPSMMILIAPFEVGFLAYTSFFQRIDTFAAMLFYFGLFVFFSLVFKIFKRSIPFAAGWWALSFPLAALSNAALRYAEHARYLPVTVLAVALLVFLSVLIAVLLVRTIHLVASGKLLAPK
jgi:tellurite resistance protein